MQMHFSGIYAKAMEIFPYEKPNEHQFQIISKITQMPQKGSLLIESPTGSGKTIASMAAIMARLQEHEKLIIVTRTVSQMEAMLREWGRIINGQGEFSTFRQRVDGGLVPLIVPMLGKARLCKQLPVLEKTMGFPKSAVHVLCQSLPCDLYPKPGSKQGGDFQRLLKLNEKILGASKSGTHVLDRLVEEYTKMTACGYFKQRSFLKYASIIVATYPYLNDSMLKGLLKQANVELEDCYILVDEAHNLVNPTSISIEKSDLDIVQMLIGDFSVIKRLQFHIKFGKRVTPGMLGTDDEIALVKDTLTHCTQDLREKYKIAFTDLSHPKVIKVSTFLSRIYSGDIIAKAGTMEIITPTPADLILNLYGSTRIFMSGTFSPIEDYKKMFGLPKAQTLVSKEISLDNQYRAFLHYRGLGSAFKMRGIHMYNLFVRIITQLVATSPRHVMLLCPSYEFLQTLYDHLKDSIEGLMYEQKELPLTHYSNALKQATTRVVLLTVAGGRLSEGVEVVKDGNSMISMVIVVGLPLSPPSEDKAIIRQALAIASGDRRSASKFMQQIPAARKIRQAFGRTIRNKRDRGAMLILDYRAEEMLKADLKLRKVMDPDDMVAQVTQFFAGYQSIA